MRRGKAHSLEFEAKVSLEATREEMALSELSRKYRMHSNQISIWKRTAVENMQAAFSRHGTDRARLAVRM